MPGPILLVEDNPSDEKLTLLAFRRSGVEAEIAVERDGVGALDHLLGTGPHANDPPPLPALVLLDLNLPRIGGLEVLRRLRLDPRTSALPVVVLTSSVQPEDIARSYALGANAYVRKPVEFSAFVDAVRTLAGFWLGLNERAPQGRS